MGSATALVFDQQSFAVHDGPGIRTILFLKGCPLGCLWCANPESQSAQVEWRQLEQRRIVVGQEETAAAYLEKIARDVPFYRNSDGGLTLSGGEPLVWPEFVEELLRGCRARGIHTLLETCGDVPADVWAMALAHANLIYFDLKHADPDEHKRLTGRPLKRILDNLRRALAQRRETIVLRLPIVPTIHDTDLALESMVHLLGELKPRAVQLVPYHGLGVAKYAQLGMIYPLAPDLPAPSPALIDLWYGRISALNIACSRGPS